MIVKTNRICVAEAILALLAVKCSGEMEQVYVEMYCNGREQGYSLSNSYNAKKVCFAEFRRSDEIVVYTGNYGEFSMQGNTPAEAVYDRKKFFSCDKLNEAVDYIHKFLNAIEKS